MNELLTKAKELKKKFCEWNEDRANGKKKITVCTPENALEYRSLLIQREELLKEVGCGKKIYYEGDIGYEETCIKNDIFGLCKDCQEAKEILEGIIQACKSY